MLGPLCFFWALPELDGVLAASVKKSHHLACYWEDNSLEGVGGISDDSDGTGVFVVHGWDKSKVHGHKFCFNGHNIHCL